MRGFPLLIVCLLSLQGSLHAASPELVTIMPRGGQRGTEVAIEGVGDRLADAVEIMTLEPGISVGKLEATAKSVKTTLTISADCPLGEHGLRIRTSSGLSAVRTFWVGALPVVNEKEPNNDSARAQKIPLNCTVHGAIGSEDVDCFVVECKRGQRLTVEVEAMRLGGAFFDAQLSVLDPHRKELLAIDDSPLTRQDPSGTLIVPEDGPYIIRLRESSYAAGDQYRLHVGTMPRPTAVFPAGGAPGEEIEVMFLGDAKGPVKRTVKLPKEVPAGGIGLWFEDDDGVSPSATPFRLNDLPNVLEKEPNDFPKEISGTTPCAFNGVIEKPADHDYYRIAVKKGQIYDIHGFARRLGSPLDPVMWVAQADGKTLMYNDDAGGSHDSYIRFTAPEDKEYLIGIRDHLQRGGETFVYRIEVTEVRPRIELSLARVAEPPSQERLTVAVPQGNRMAALVNVRRLDCGGVLQLELSGLPENVKAITDPVPAGMATAPVLFEATEQAEVAGTSARMAAKPSDGTPGPPSRFEQPFVLIYYLNQTVFHTYRSEVLPVAVSTPVPFRINIVEPKAPLVRGGTMPLKIVAERVGEFKGPIRVQPLYNPPGVSAPGEVSIPEAQSEVILPLTANGNAGLGPWKYVVVGVADVGGAVRASSQLAPIEVAQPFVQITLERANVEQGGHSALRGKVAVTTPFEGPAKVQLLGLPPKVKSQEVEINAEAKEISFPVTAEESCPPGMIRNLFCQVTLSHKDEPVAQATGSAELRVDAPLKKKPAATPPPKPSEKPMSRLEQLRKEAAGESKP